MESPRSGIPSVKTTHSDSSPTTPAALLLLRASSNRRNPPPVPLHFPSPCHLYPVPARPPCFCLPAFPPEPEFNTTQRQLQVYYRPDGVCLSRCVQLLPSQRPNVAAVGEETTPVCCCGSFGTQMRRSHGARTYMCTMEPVLLLQAWWLFSGFPL